MNYTFFFTATGNSLYVAKQLGGQLISIPQEMQKPHRAYEAETIGIVSPIYFGEIPEIVQRFISESTFKADYVYIVLTYGGGYGVSTLWSKLFAAGHGLNVNYVKSVFMSDNFLPYFDMNQQKSIEADKKIDEQIKVIIDDITARKNYIQPVPDENFAMYAKANVNKASHIAERNGSAIQIIKDKCVGCGTCVKVCPVGNFFVQDKKAQRHRDTCEFCLACAHACPEKAITLSTRDLNPDARYRNSNIKLADIIKANNIQVTA